MTKVYIIGGNGDYRRLFEGLGMEVVTSAEECDLLVFTGGEDVNPELYGQGCHRTTHFNRSRDTWEQGIFAAYFNKPKVGICRGGQLLNVLSGGSMFQDVNNHCRGPHPIFSPEGVQLCMATSTHHQMMIPGEGAEVLAVANESTVRYTHAIVEQGAHADTEVVYYEATQSLCFQPHPEFGVASDALKTYFGYLLKDKLGV
jgi:gamma-glutamyl-gamma-aminobutyrate hydrolase PuuD